MQSVKRHNMLKLWKLSRKHDFLYIYVSRFVNKVYMSHAMHHVYTTVTKVIYRYSNFFPVDKSKFNASAHIYSHKHM